MPVLAYQANAGLSSQCKKRFRDEITWHFVEMKRGGQRVVVHRFEDGMVSVRALVGDRRYEVVQVVFELELHAFPESEVVNIVFEMACQALAESEKRGGVW